MALKRVSTLALAAFALLGACLVAPQPVRAEDFPKTVYIAAGERAGERSLRVGKGRSVVLEVAEPVADVLISNPEIADGVVRSRNRVILLGRQFGQSNVVLFAATGQEIASFSVRVEPDTSDLNAILRRMLPGADIRAESINGNLVLTGTAPSTGDAQRAMDLANRFARQASDGSSGAAGAAQDDNQSVLNLITVAGKDQIQLKVTVAEVERSIIKQLGVSLSGAISAGNFTPAFNSPAQFPVNSGSLVQSATGLGFLAGGTNLNAQIRALQRDGVIRTLAEPTLTAISGENASFLAGGEFPIPVSQDNDTIGVEFKSFGVGLDFTPVVLNEGNISLRIKTEVSELSDEGSVNIGSLVIPAIKVRRAESTVELPSGGTLVMAGLLRESYKQSISGVPGLMQLPVLGALFKSRDFLRQQTELVVFVTPYVVQPVAASQVARPDQNLAPANDAETVFLNRLNKVYAAPGLRGTYHGQVGFIYE
ncbi:BON domain-containing protein [Microvirga tunisiensis]|uniref:BON domain-containing protein n=2 Tax=Pannonibacter tanglangensis TaxID=2750084 RepID=A0ABW9ZIP4_9HYPH|nr:MULTISPECIES: type II and III secretion system protein family protein [unclassified Pannonibacter]NBN64661.1 BON domain-containing protein [Pannonibacter sp. XCT-34]NBN79196.1 BON domain-containing protein [Pannonibacter sp. XCT-53]